MLEAGPQRPPSPERRGALSWPAVALGLVMIACGAVADGGAEEESSTEDVSMRRRRAVDAMEPARGATPAPAMAPVAKDPEPPTAEELAREIESDPPRQLSEVQFNVLLDVYCLDCHKEPPCSAACDGFWFDDWDGLARDDGYALQRTIEYLLMGYMPPSGSLRPAAVARDLMIEFIERSAPPLALTNR